MSSAALRRVVEARRRFLAGPTDDGHARNAEAHFDSLAEVHEMALAAIADGNEPAQMIAEVAVGTWDETLAGTGALHGGIE